MEFEKNPDGTDKLDEQGNPIPVKVTDTDEEVAKVKAQLVEEIKELRLKNGIMEGLLKDKKPEAPVQPKAPETDEEKLEALVEKKLKEKEASSAKANKTAAFEKFVTENKEFHPDNDSLGLKRQALQRKLAQFNTDELTSVEEFYSVIGDAKRLLVGNDNPPETFKDKNPYSNPGKINSNPSGKRDEELTPKELKLAQTTGKTKEQILKLKIKNPEYLAQLLEYVRD